MADSKLSPKQRRFIEAYLQTWNASEAARQAGYRGAADRIGSRLLRNVEMQAEMRMRLTALGMQSDEVIKRLSDQAGLNAARFFEFGPDAATGEIRMKGVNWAMVQQYGHLVKKISYSRQGQVMLEFHDAQRALELIGKALGLFVDKVDLRTSAQTLDVHLYLPENGRGIPPDPPYEGGMNTVGDGEG